MFRKLFRRLRFGVVALQLALTGHLVAARYNLAIDVNDAATGALVHRQEHHNLVVTAGLNLIRDVLASTFLADGTHGITHFAVGTGTTTPAIGQTALTTEVTRETVTNMTKSSGTLVISYYMASGVGNGSTLAEVGLFNAASSGSMYARALVSPVISKTSLVTVTYVWTLTWS